MLQEQVFMVASITNSIAFGPNNLLLLAAAPDCRGRRPAVPEPCAAHPLDLQQGQRRPGCSALPQPCGVVSARAAFTFTHSSEHSQQRLQQKQPVQI
jgi:hypothetical protein